MKAKMSDIAKKAGVSIAAVSLVLNGKPGVSEKTRKKIFKIIKESDYVPLRQKRESTRVIANVNLIIISDQHGVVNEIYQKNPFFDTLVQCTAEHIDKFGGTLQINTVQIESLHEEINRIISRTTVVNAIVLATDLDENDIDFIESKIKNVVFVDTSFRKLRADFVTPDNYQGAYAAGMFLLSHNYRRIGYLASNKATQNFLSRREGIRDSLATQNIKLAKNDFYVVDFANLFSENSLNCIDYNDLPEAFFCENDIIAIRLIKELTHRNFRVPRDIGIMGFDDVSTAALCSPELTTVHIPTIQIVEQAVRDLQAQVASKDFRGQKTFITAEIIEREST
ncbi:LacI family DNA-binding transcriptional regulator [Lactobacillus jensenii]|uniref:LacI family DNA-binding transcriptional regulator n=1 Tax=Lactobacillus jensenii TaxID=109790 RepID=UPI0001B95FF8|nr:LacI family DNA-binding transcriptional regulator [Lactobacillus jensenii]EEX27567.1 transcriptional regulator, LacI family [Lactobacillus jensenii SJ-7A-US]MCF1852013.1 LacI family DNA-binding transcriptional regulator [Lactobacillus jensenii]MCW8072135.1 LacI family DNA-binding transcriptional regulator [Lactobacillus jensenii]MDK6782832.1 LacI family DNA-binding transcriptional regulator [Lactobacillus jensenii]MDK7319318.1 LacI family DNA-binding transcriptional regulator [Lactobacillus